MAGGEPAAKRKKAKKKDQDETPKNNKAASRSMPPPLNLPMSTNVSSPAQAASRQRKTRKPEELHPKHYKRDAFVVSDRDDREQQESDDDYDDAFEPVRVAGRPQKNRTRQLGPPITADEKMDGLNDIHRMIVDDFVGRAKAQCQKILLAKSLRGPPFTDIMLREMAIRFTRTESEMIEIPDIDPDKVALYGKVFIKLVKDFHLSYIEMMQQQEEERPADPDAQNVIDLVSDEEEADYGSSIGASDFEEEADEGESSNYFQPHEPVAKVAAFNARFSQSQSAAMRTAPKKEAAKAPYKKRYSKGRKGQARRSGGESTESRGGYGDELGAPSRVVKHKASARRRGSGTGNGSGGPARRGGGIYAMPT